MVVSPDELVQGKHHFAMVDEVDSVLIDDARTPLIISGPVAQGQEEQEYIDLKPKVERIIEAQKRMATQFLTEARKLLAEGKTGYEEGNGGMSLLRSYRALPKNRALIKYLSEEGVKVVLQKAENHFMQEQSKNMHIADAPILLQSFGTFIDYSKGRFSWLKVQIERDLVTYAEALESAKAHAKILQLEDQVNISGYATHLGPVEDSETWIPVVRLPNAVVWILLNCNWERMSEAREQLQKVTCRPTLNFSPPE